jgi:ribosomal protein S18 acetylase RimI-like enzyme
MNLRMMEIDASNAALLSNFLYEAIFVPSGMQPPSRDILADPQLQVYVQDFGKQTGDFGLFAEVEGVIAGAVWARIMEDYGHIDNETPSLAIALYKEYRGKGVGTALLQAMLKLLQEQGYEQVSLAVQKENYAVKLYTACGFRVYRESEEEYIMVRSLRQNTACTSQEGAL